MGELPPTGGAAFIAAAGGVAHTRGGGGVIWPVDIPEGEGALFGTKGRALGQPASLCHTKWAGWGTLHKLRQLTLEIRQRSILVDSTASSLINQSCESPELRLRKKAGRCLVSEVPPPPVDKLRRLVTLPTRGGSFDLLANACPGCLRLSS